METPGSNNHFPEKQTWGTREELLLACAVNRYGNENWTAVAAEIKKRSSKIQLLTPLSCQQKYTDLKRRFTQNDAGSTPDDGDGAIPWLDQLKKNRVAELKRELQLYDISIVSLQLKVKRLTEERVTKETENGGEAGEMIKENGPESFTDKPDGGEESDRENRSVNESNSTDQKAEKPMKDKAPVEPVRGESEGVKAVGEDSCNGSCGSAAKELEGNSERVDLAELGESVAESRERESGDMHSSVSLLRKEGKGEEPEEVEPDNIEGQSLPATKRECVESQPLVECLEILRSHRFGSLFERLDIKETPNYGSLVRIHIDLDMIRERLEKSWYSSSISSFFRDLLLLFNNAIVFFNKNSVESIAAVELRQIVLKAMTRNTFDLLCSSLKEEPLASPAAAENIKLEVLSSDSLLSKPNILAPLIACRKRSSITAKRAVSISSPLEAKTKEYVDSSDGKSSVPSSIKSDQGTCGSKKRLSESSSTGKGNSRKNKKSQGNMKTKKNLDVDINADHGSSDVEETDRDNSKRKNKVNASAKKRSAEIFLSRITRSSTLKDTVISSEDSKSERTEQKKKKGNGKVDAKKEEIVQKRSGGKREEDRKSPVKKTAAGRLGKRGVTPEPVTRGKRRKGSVETDASGSPGIARKRSRK